MNHRQSEYILAIAKYQNISKAADSLFLSRSALNEYLLTLEKHYGTPLFERRKKQLYPTYAGECYLEAARKILGIQDQLDKKLHEITDASTGRINIGVNRSVGEKIFRETFPYFHQKYPGYIMKLTAVENLEHELLQGNIDWAITGYGSAKPVPAELEQLPLDRCEIVLALPKAHPLARFAAPPGQPHNTIDLNLLKDEKFILLHPGKEARIIADQHFEYANFTPQILIECNGGLIAGQMVNDGLGPSILVETLVSNYDNVCCFSLTPKAYWTHSVAYRKGSVFSQAENYYLNLIRQHLQNGIA